MKHPSLALHRMLALALGLAALGIATAAQAENPWEGAHPRREQVWDRAGNLQRRIGQERNAGDLAPARAHALWLQVQSVRRQEQAMAAVNGGYLTPEQQTALNQEEDLISRRIGT